MHLLCGTLQPKKIFKKLEQIQKRLITNEYSHLTRVTPIVKSLNLETLEDRRSKSKVVIIHKALNSNLEVEPNKNLLQPSDKYRDKNTFFIPYARTNAYKYSFFPSGRAWNGLPDQTRKTNILSYTLQTLLLCRRILRPTLIRGLSLVLQLYKCFE